MANIKSSAKRARQAEVRHARNSSVLTELKTSQRKLRTAIAEGKLADAKTQLAAFSSSLDKAAKRGVIHRNSADRRKATFARALKPKAA
jgi:small subunit ribosomal protein S20